MMKRFHCQEFGVLLLPAPPVSFPSPTLSCFHGIEWTPHPHLYTPPHPGAVLESWKDYPSLGPDWLVWITDIE